MADAVAGQRYFRWVAMKIDDETRQEIEALGLTEAFIDRIRSIRNEMIASVILHGDLTDTRSFRQFYPDLTRFAAQRRTESPWEQPDELSRIDAAVIDILRKKFRDTYRQPNEPYDPSYAPKATIFLAPAALLRELAVGTPSRDQYPIFLTERDWDDWQTARNLDDAEPLTYWYQTWWWTAIVNPTEVDRILRSFGKNVVSRILPEGATAVVVESGQKWAPHGGGFRVELWYVLQDASFEKVESLADVRF